MNNVDGIGRPRINIAPDSVLNAFEQHRSVAAAARSLNISKGNRLGQVKRGRRYPPGHEPVRGRAARGEMQNDREGNKEEKTMVEIWDDKVVNEGDIKVSFSICPDCGKPVCILRGGYMPPRDIDAMGLCQSSMPGIDIDTNQPEPGTRIHEFKNLVDARRRYAGYIDDPRLKPGLEKAYAVARPNSRGTN